uniref:SFRICE_027643 n=1 Tax=Spodoptera frugiperda TaxID=7108 RepID=A0A2H1X1X2_SPOFR
MSSCYLKISRSLVRRRTNSVHYDTLSTTLDVAQTNYKASGVRKHVLTSTCHLKVDICNVGFVKDFKSLTANRKLLKANPPLTSVTGDHHGVQCIKGDFCSAAYLAYLVPISFMKHIFDH